MAPATVTVASSDLSQEDREKVSQLRQERWALLLHFHEKAGTQHYCKTAEYTRLRLQFAIVCKQLYMLTNNPIYNACQ